MIKITKRETSKTLKPRYENLQPGTVFKWNCGIISLKLEGNECVHLTTTAGDDLFEKKIKVWKKEIAEVYGMIDEIIVKEIQ